MTNRKSSIINNQSKNVWRIFHFVERFEMDGYVRQSGLDYVRMFVSATTGGKSNESTEFLAQLAELEHYYPEQRDAYEGRFWRLLRLTAPKEDWLRGYLLDADQRPLTATRLAARLHLSVPVMNQTLTALKRVGLIEYVPCPRFEKPERGKKENKKKAEGRTGRGKSCQTGPKTPEKKAVKKNSETFQNVSESFKKSESDKIENGNRTEYEEEILGLSSSDKEKQSETKQSRKRTGRAQGQEPSQDRTTTSPTTTPASPTYPTVSDKGGSAKTVSDDGDSAKVIPFAGSPGSVDGSAGEMAEIADGKRRVKARLNPQAQAAALEIYRQLGGAWPPDEKLRRTAQDLGAFRNAFVRVFEAGLPPPVAAELWDSLVAEAERLRKVYRANGGYQIAKKTWFKPVLTDKLDARLKRCKTM